MPPAPQFAALCFEGFRRVLEQDHPLHRVYIFAARDVPFSSRERLALVSPPKYFLNPFGCYVGTRYAYHSALPNALH